MSKLNEFLDEISEATKYTSIEGQFAHKHKYKIDKAGTGITTITNGDGPEHQHQINTFAVQAASNDGHTHTIEENRNGSEEIN